MASLSFIKDFEKSCEKMETVSSESGPPRYWYSTGNYVLNYILSGHFDRGIPQGRITGLAGPSGSGKSFIQCNVTKQSQVDDTYILMLDSENALDDEFVSKIGVNVEKDYNYKGVTTLNDVVALLSSFIQGYKKNYGTDINAPKVLVVIDSLDMLLTETELKHFETGESRGDMGQRAKQTKNILKSLVQQIKDLNIAILITHQVYAATQENILKGQSDGNWMINGAVKYSLSHLLLITKLKLKDGDSISGIRMKCQAVKTRFTKPFQDVTIEVPYDTGMDPYSGLCDVAEALGVIEKKGSYKKIVGTDLQFYAKNIGEYKDVIFEKISALENVTLKMTEVLGLEEELNEAQSNASKRDDIIGDKLKQAVIENKNK
jgi:recombination protein RecA